MIEGKADEEDKATFSEVEVMDEEHPFLSEDFTRRKIMSKKLGIGATPADIVIALQQRLTWLAVDSPLMR